MYSPARPDRPAHFCARWRPVAWCSTLEATLFRVTDPVPLSRASSSSFPKRVARQTPQISNECPSRPFWTHPFEVNTAIQMHCMALVVCGCAVSTQLVAGLSPAFAVRRLLSQPVAGFCDNAQGRAGGRGEGANGQHERHGREGAQCARIPKCA